MESMKRNWGKPGLDVQMFTPEEYCHSCWSVMCNMNNTAAFVDDNSDGNYDYGERKHTNESHTPAELVILGDSETPKANCWASTDYSPDRNTVYSYENGFVRAYWFKATRYNRYTRRWEEQPTAQHMCDLTAGSYWPYKDDYGHVRPNHS